MARYICLISQILVLVPVWIDVICAGFTLGFPAVLLPTLRRNDTEIEIDQNSGSTIVAVRGIGYFAFLIVVSIITQKKGRKIARIVSVVPSIVGWSLGYFSTSKSHLLAMNIFLGLSHGGIMATTPMIISEYTSPIYRGVFFISLAIAQSVGILVVQTLGTYIYWRTITLVALCISVTNMIIAFFWPESPYFLAIKQRFDECKKTFVWLRGKDEVAQSELKDIITKYSNDEKESPKKRSFIETLKESLKMLKHKGFRYPMLIVFLMFNLIELGGRNVFNAYSVTIVSDVIQNEALAYRYVIIQDSISLGCAFVSVIFVRLFKRRTLLFASSIASIFNLFGFSIILYLTRYNILPPAGSWVAMVLLSIYVTLLNLGAHSLTSCIFGEVFPVAYKATGGVFFNFYVVVLNTFCNKFAPYIMSVIEVQGMYMICGIFFSINLFVLYKILPETKNKTLRDIERHWEEMNDGVRTKCRRMTSGNVEEALIESESKN